MNYFTHSTIVLILAIIILLVLLIYTNYLDKSKKVKKQVMLKLDRDEPTQEPSTTVSNNTNHWSDNQLYLHSFSEPLDFHEHSSDFPNSKGHIIDSSSHPTHLSDDQKEGKHLFLAKITQIKIKKLYQIPMILIMILLLIITIQI